MTEELTRAAPDAVGSVNKRRVDLRLYAWGDIAEHTDEGIREQLMPGVFGDVDPTRVTLESQRHGGALVGVGEAIQEREDGIHSTFRIAQTPAGDELLALISPGPEGEAPVLRDASVVFKPQGQRIAPGGIVQRTAADLRRVAIVERGAYKSATVVAVRSEPVTEETTEQPQEQAAPPPVVMERAEPDTSRIDALEDRIAKLVTLASVPGASDHPLSKYGSLAEYTGMVYRGEAEPDLLQRALAEQETANNAGVIPENWLKDVKRIVNLGRRGITAMGGPRPIGASGMTVDYPYLNSANTLTAVHTEVDAIQTARVDIAKGSEDILTFAGGSMMSYQLIQRSDPSYREAYNRIIMASWANLTDSNFISQLEADATGAKVLSGLYGPAIALANPSAHADDIFDTTPDHGFSAGDAVVFSSLTGGDATTAALVGRVVWVVPTSLAAKTFRVALTPGGSAITWGTADLTAGNVHKVDTTGEYFRSALFEASVAVEDAVGSPAGAVIASTDMFLALAGLSDFVAPIPGGVNADASGLANASTLRMVSSGLEIVRDPNVSAGKIIVSSPMAASWHEDGPKFATAEDVNQLGTQVAVYSFGAGVVHTPAGVVEMTLI